MGAIGTDTDGVRVCRHPDVTDVDVVATIDKVAAFIEADADVEVLNGVVEESALPQRSVLIAGGHVRERLKSAGRVAAARDVAQQSAGPGGSVGVTRVVIQQGPLPAGRVLTARGIVGESLGPAGHVVVADGVGAKGG